MNRREAIEKILGLAVVAPAFPKEPERALSLVQPVCPKCGLMVMFQRRAQSVTEPVPVRCPCGWSGVSSYYHQVSHAPV